LATAYQNVNFFMGVGVLGAHPTAYPNPTRWTTRVMTAWC